MELWDGKPFMISILKREKRRKGIDIFSVLAVKIMRFGPANTRELV